VELTLEWSLTLDDGGLSLHMEGTLESCVPKVDGDLSLHVDGTLECVCAEG
jgi:hypothetical protein